MSKKKAKQKRISEDFKTCIIGMLVFLVIGIGLILYGKLWNGVTAEDITKVPATIVKITRVKSDNSKNKKEQLRELGYTYEEVEYDFKIEYEFIYEGEKQTYVGRKSYSEGRFFGVGDFDELRVASKHGKVVVNPDLNGYYIFFGVIAIIVSAIAGALAIFFRPKK